MSIARPNWDLISRHARAVGAGRLLMCLYCIVAFGLVAASVAVAQDAPNSLDDIEVRALPGNRIELRLVTSGNAPEPLAFTIDEPARIAIDLRDTVLGLKVRRKDVGIGALDTILAAEANGRTRVVLNLDVSVGYQTRVEGNSIVVTLDSVAGSGSPTASMVAAATPTRSTGSGESVGRSIESIDFRRTESGAGRLNIELSAVGTAVDVRRTGDQVVLSFSGTELPKSLMKRLDVMDFATPVTTIDAKRVGGDTRIVITASTGLPVRCCVQCRGAAGCRGT